MLLNWYVQILYGVFTVDAVVVDIVGNAVVDCVENVLVVNVVPNFNTLKY